MSDEIVIVDYGMANLRSVQKAFEHVGQPAVIANDPERLAAAKKLVLPGVGAFCDGIAQLRSSGLTEPIFDHVRAGRPLLGICLGLQFLFSRSHEDGLFSGLDLFKGDVVRFANQPGLKVPHMGWNQLRFRKKNCPLFHGLSNGDAVYFVHSYYAAPQSADLVAAEADYPTPFAAAVWQDNVFATQFHPEKSQAVGLTMLKNFSEL
ncbi:MAG: imidazole glycerol phosphate synthase subunit HisH [Gemmataceae bacterium]